MRRGRSFSFGLEVSQRVRLSKQAGIEVQDALAVGANEIAVMV